jgi:hypothetical protein
MGLAHKPEEKKKRLKTPPANNPTSQQTKKKITHITKIIKLYEKAAICADFPRYAFPRFFCFFFLFLFFFLGTAILKNSTTTKKPNSNQKARIQNAQILHYHSIYINNHKNNDNVRKSDNLEKENKNPTHREKNITQKIN